MKTLLILACLISLAGSWAIVEDRRNNSTAICIRKAMHKLFSHADSITFVTDHSELCDIVPLELKKPVVTVDFKMDVKNVNFFRTSNDFVICVKNEYAMYYAAYLISILKWTERKGQSDVRVLVISPESVARIIHQCWKNYLYNVVLLSWGSGEGVLIVADQFAKGNNCGGSARVIEKESCAGIINIQFPKASNLNQCELVLVVYHTSRFRPEGPKSYPDVVYIMQFVMPLMVEYFNAKYVVHVVTRPGEQEEIFKRSKNICISLYAYDNPRVNRESQPILSDSIVWIVPKSLPVPAIRVVLRAFKSLVWYLIIFTFVSTVFVWWLIVGFQNRRFRLEDGLDALTNVSSLTILGSIPVTPRSFVHRSVVIAYLIYIIHMSCAFTSNWIKLLTVPQYEFQIKTLQQLADANLPIYINDGFQNSQFNRNDTKNDLYEKLQTLLIPCDTDEALVAGIMNIHNYRNCAAVVSHQDVMAIQIHQGHKLEVIKIEDNSVTGEFHVKFTYKRNYYFAVHINTFLQKLVESGIGAKKLNELETEYSKKVIVEEVPDKVQLSLGHLYFAFCLLGLGLVTALVVFLIELFTGFLFK